MKIKITDGDGALILTALRSMVEYWREQRDIGRDELLTKLADEQVKTWNAFHYKMENLIEGAPDED